MNYLDCDVLGKILFGYSGCAAVFIWSSSLAVEILSSYTLKKTQFTYSLLFFNLIVAVFKIMIRRPKVYDCNQVQDAENLHLIKNAQSPSSKATFILQYLQSSGITEEFLKFSMSRCRRHLLFELHEGGVDISEREVEHGRLRHHLDGFLEHKDRVLRAVAPVENVGDREQPEVLEVLGGKVDGGTEASAKKSFYSSGKFPTELFTILNPLKIRQNIHVSEQSKIRRSKGDFQARTETD